MEAEFLKHGSHLDFCTEKAPLAGHCCGPKGKARGEGGQCRATAPQRGNGEQDYEDSEKGLIASTSGL